MMTDNLTKALPVIKHKQSIKKTGIEDKKKLLAFIILEDDLRDIF